ncbi:MAG TPA: TIGR02281 family clan AA aspartic protease [Rhizomicrobium sp.]|nr:TIGR02281 family clan AA aspartic protease [Rhizomicrobium sp.]
MSNPGPWGRPAPRRKTSRFGLYLWLGVIVAAGLLLLVLGRYFPGGDAPLRDPGVVQTLGFLVLASSGLLFVREFNLKRTARNLLLWLAAGFALILGFAFRNELTDLTLRLRSSLVPGYAIQTGVHELTLSEGEGGHYHVYATVNGAQVSFLIDTGASDIVLDPSDAKRLGFDLASLNFDRPFGSANGIGHGASAEVDSLSVGNFHLSHVAVSINGAEMGSSLLGMSFLRRLKSYSFSGGKLILRW